MTQAFVPLDDAGVVSDTLPPFIYHLDVIPYQNGAAALEIRWDTDEPATSSVDYGLTTNYELGNESSGSLTTDHMITVVGLQYDLTYYLAVGSEDANGNTSFVATSVDTTVSSGPSIDVWYGDDQRFGDLGVPQRWVNVLGNVSSDTTGLTYSLNGGPQRSLSLGPNLRRLAYDGDFNCELHVDDLSSGQNEVLLRAVDGSGESTVSRVFVTFNRDNVWPLPYQITDWNAYPAIEDAGQVVDGLWGITSEGVRTVETWYDRVIAIGDRTWSNYEVLVSVTVHNVDFLNGNPAPSNGPAVGILTLWPGHTVDPNFPDRQPTEKFTPFGACMWYRWNANGNWGQEIYVNPGAVQISDRTKTITYGQTYWLRCRTEILNGNQPHYLYSMWQDGQAEPSSWELEGWGNIGDPTTGSFLLLAHHVDATFGPVTVTPVP